MRATERMYQILEEMVDSVEHENHALLMSLDKAYECNKRRAVYTDMHELLAGKYDSCKQAIIMAEREPYMRDQLLEEARKHLDKISRPRTLT